LTPYNSLTGEGWMFSVLTGEARGFQQGLFQTDVKGMSKAIMIM
jgi:hypothetical protein